ncbi:1-acyl-sn-glycerol-3-phosphate acyltransferase [Maridesulfovibrio ferrireducens]|uniref:lysophospholipid acyltransferase family protein n=1 Tax=Maridesulfovibrio ferrireducens TaxID=246191 RepID=UPI001A2CDF92|nr:lysophospholipid acyltransferase family protein [Maridesulfovibrio ferrireducens]MBI9113093.1 1-acyl-sn-glycerol-3-phosphate acyltransferase [Maridesulfovibrio ferrireducens]
MIASATKRIAMSAIIWASSILLTILLFLVMLTLRAMTFPFDRKRKIQHAQCFWWSEIVIRINPYWNVAIEGLDNIDKDRTYVVVANHQSMADIAMLFQTRMQFKWIAKDSLFRVPFLGWCMSLAKHIRLKRSNLSSIRKAYREASIWIDNGMSVTFFPEGTRSETGDLGTFRNGAFKLALKKKVAVLPIAIQGTGGAIPKGKWIFNTSSTIRMTVLPALEPDDFQGDVRLLMDTAREAIRKAL